MGILDDIIAKKGGIAELTHELLGGTAYITYVNKYESEYDYETASYKYSSDDTTEPVRFVPRTIGSKYVTANKQDMIEKTNIIGTVPACEIKQPLRNGIDKFSYKGQSYVVIQTDLISVGNKKALYVLYGKLTDE